jgi:hypothetical protein
MMAELLLGSESSKVAGGRTSECVRHQGDLLGPEQESSRADEALLADQIEEIPMLIVVCMYDCRMISLVDIISLSVCMFLCSIYHTSPAPHH